MCLLVNSLSIILFLHRMRIHHYIDEDKNSCSAGKKKEKAHEKD